jgi:hypothetical protein
MRLIPYLPCFFIFPGRKQMRNLVLTDKHLIDCVETGCLVEVRIWGKAVEVTRIVSFNEYSITAEDGGKYLRESSVFMRMGLRLV